MILKYKHLTQVLLSAAIIFVLALSSLSICEAEQIGIGGEQLFKKYAPAIYQVQSISNKSSKKYTIGSGFQISKQGFIVTNYHVVAESVLYPESLYVQVVADDGSEQKAQVINVDVIHDLAIVKIAHPQEIELPLGSSEINKGKRLFSIGNPEDVGMMIIEGVSNGYMDKALYKKVLTSLPLNPGMSGGPALDEEGNVIGVNVMTGGNSLSFLVPVEFLKKLWDETVQNNFKPAPKFVKQLQKQLINEENEYFTKVIAQQWDKQHFGQFKVPSTISSEITCWGAPGDRGEYWVDFPSLTCSVKDDIFISSTLKAHTINISYVWVKSVNYNPLRFYNLNNIALTKSSSFDLDDVLERDVHNFQCTTSIVNIAGNPFWVSTCARKLKQLERLYDINVRMASLGEMQTMLRVDLTLGAVTQKTAKAFLEKFYREFEWVK